MTESKADKAATSEEEAPPEPDIISPEPDVMLAGLVDLLNRSPGAELGVTLHVSGTVVSGLMISGESFIDRQRAALAELGEAGASLAGYFDIFRNIYVEKREADEPFLKPPLPFYIHLRSASILDAASNQITFPLWRGRLSEVSGWSIGNLGTIE